MDEAAYVAEVLRLHERYAVEIVERWNVCPWARRAREAGEWVREVLLQREPALEPSLRLIERLEADPKKPPVAIAIYPRLAMDPRRFDEFAGRLRAADQARHRGRPVYVSASFHPDYPLSTRSPAALVPWFRRSPDPSLQLIRFDVIEEARRESGKFLFDFSAAAWAELQRRQEQPSVTDKITRDNADTFARAQAELEAAYASILADRDAVRARFE